MHTHALCVPLAPAIIHHFGLSEQNLEKPIFISLCFSLKAVYNSFKLQSRRCFCLYWFLPILTQSFLPGIGRLYSSSSKNFSIKSNVKFDRFLPCFELGLANIPFFFSTRVKLVPNILIHQKTLHIFFSTKNQE